MADVFNPVAALRSAVDDPDLVGRALLVAVALIRHADRRGGSYPSVTTLAAKLGLGRSTVLRAIADLEADGYLSVQRSPGQRSSYRYHHDTGTTVTPVSEGDGGSPEMVPDQSHGETTPVSRQDPKLPKKEPKNIPTEDEAPRRADDVPLPGGLDTARFRQAWGEWLAYRREHRWPVKAAWAERQLAQLSKHSPHVAITALEQSMAQGWQGVFPEKVTAGNRQHGPGRGVNREDRAATHQDDLAEEGPPAVATTMEAESLWAEALDELRRSLDPHSFGSWIEPLAGGYVDDDELVVLSESETTAQHVPGRWGEEIRQALGCRFRIEVGVPAERRQGAA